MRVGDLERARMYIAEIKRLQSDFKRDVTPLWRALDTLYHDETLPDDVQAEARRVLVSIEME